MKPRLPKTNISSSALICILLVSLACTYRVIQACQMEWPNFSPVMAIALGCGLYLRGWIRWCTPIIMQSTSDYLLSTLFEFRYSLIDSWPIYLSYLIATWIGKQLAKSNSSYFHRLLGCVGCSAIFYLLTNSAAWWSEPLYAKTFAGWLQALTTGLPGYPPTWTFFRNSLASDVIFFSLLHLSIIAGKFQSKTIQLAPPQAQ